MSKFFRTILLISALSISAASSADGVRRFNSNVDAAATTDWVNNWIAHVTAVPVETVTAGSIEPLPFGLPLSNSPSYVNTGTAKGSLILSQQAALLGTAITNCLIADLPERATAVRLGIEGSVLGILVDLDGSTPSQRFYQSRLASAGCPTVVEKPIPGGFTKLYLAADSTLSAKNSSSGGFSVLNYNLLVSQTLPSTNIELTTYRQPALAADATLSVQNTPPLLTHGSSTNSDSFYADRVAFDDIGRFGSSESQFVSDPVSITSEPLDSEGLIATPGGGYGFSGPAIGLEGKFDARPEVLLRVAGAPQDCNPGQITWSEQSIDGSGSHVFQVTEQTVKNTGAGSNGFVQRAGNRWAARYTLGGSFIPSGLSLGGERELWTMNAEISQLSSGSVATEAVRRAKVKEMVQSWFDNRYIDYKTANNEDYTGGKYRYFKEDVSSPAESSIVTAGTKDAVMSAFADTIVNEFSAWIVSGNPSDLSNLVLNLQSGLGVGSNARCGIQQKSSTIEARDEDSLSLQGKAYVEHMEQGSVIYKSWYHNNESDGDAEVQFTIKWDVKTLLSRGEIIAKAKSCIASNQSSYSCAVGLSFSTAALEKADCASSSYKYATEGNTWGPEEEGGSVTHTANPAGINLQPLGCYPWHFKTDDDDNGGAAAPGEHPIAPGSLSASVESAGSTSVSNLDTFFGTKMVTGALYHRGCPTNDNFSSWPDFITNGASGTFPGSATASPWDYGVAGFKAGAGTQAEQDKIKSFLGRGFYRTKTKISTLAGGCEAAFASGEMVTYFYAPSSGTYNLTVDSVGANRVRTGSSASTIEVLNESGAPITIASNGSMNLKRGLHTLRLAFELSDTELAAAVSRDQRIAVTLDSSDESLPLFLSSRLAKASDPVKVNGSTLNSNSDQFWDGEYKPNVFVGLKPGVSSASVTDLRGMGGRFGIQSVYSAGNKLLVVSVDDAQKTNPRLRFDLVNSLGATTADVGVSIDTVGVKTPGLPADEMLKVWQVKPSVAGGAYILFSYKRGSLTFKGDQGWGLWVDESSAIGTKSKSSVSNDIGETFALLKIDPLTGASWISDPLRVSEEDVATATMTEPGVSNYTSIALQVRAGDNPVSVNLAGGIQETIAANIGAHSQLWFNKELGWAATDSEIAILFGQTPYRAANGVVGVPLDMNIARMDPDDTTSAAISTEELEEAVSLQDKMIFLPTSMPPGSTVENSVIINKAEGNTFEIIPLRPGEFQLQFPRSANNPLDVLTMVVESRMPSAANDDEKQLLITHIADAPPVDLDPSEVDEFVFLQMAYAQAPGVNDPPNAPAYNDLEVFGSLFYHTQPSALTAESDPAQAVLVYKDNGEWAVRVVQSVRWNNTSVFDRSSPETAWIGEPMSYYDHYAGLNNDLRGYLVGENGYEEERISVINLDIIDDAIYSTTNMRTRQRATSPIYPVADNSKFDPSSDSNKPVDVVWYRKHLNAAWPDKTIRYETKYPGDLNQEVKFSERETGTAPTIYIGSQLGSEGYSYEGQDAVDTDISDLYFEPDLVQNLKVYRQPERSKFGYNPNEEHALIAEAKGGGGKRKAVFALRNDLNVTATYTSANVSDSKSYTSKPFVLVQYETREKLTDGTYTEWLPAMRGYHVKADNPELGYNFQVAGAAGQVVAPPYPLEIVLPSAQGPYMGLVGSKWQENADEETNTVAPRVFSYNGSKNMGFWQDRNGEFWHAAATEKDDSDNYIESELTKLNWAYPLLGEFDVPTSSGTECDTPEQSIMLWCANGLSALSRKVTSTHTVDWPDEVAELWAGETATFAGGYASAKDTTKPGLPGVIGMASLEVLYDSKNRNGTAFAPDERKNKFSAAAVPVLSETTQPFAFAEWPKNLLPSTGNMKVDGSKWLFSDLAPSFQDRLFYDTQREKLIFKGRLAGKVLGDKTLTEAPIGPVLLESNVASQELVNQVWDLFEKHSAADLKQSIATLLRKSREPDFKNPALNDNLVDASLLEEQTDFNTAILDNWLVGTRDIGDTVALAESIQSDVDRVFAQALGKDKLETIVDFGSKPELQDKLHSGSSSQHKRHISCTTTAVDDGNESHPYELSDTVHDGKGKFEAKFKELGRKAKSEIAKVIHDEFDSELSRWLIENVNLLAYNGQLSDQQAFYTSLNSYDAFFGMATLQSKAEAERAKKSTTVTLSLLTETSGGIGRTESYKVYSRDFQCSLDANALTIALLERAKEIAWSRAVDVEGLKAGIRGDSSVSLSLIGRLSDYWKETKTTDGSDKPKTPVVLALLKTAVDNALINNFTVHGPGANLKDMIPAIEDVAKKKDNKDEWLAVAESISLNTLLLSSDQDSNFAGGTVGLELRIAEWKDTLVADSDAANYVNRGALGPGIALVSNPEMLKGGDDWNEPSYVSVVENNDPSVAGLPITIHVVKINPLELATPALMPLQPSNVFDEKVSLIVSNDFAGNNTDLRFDWRWREDTGSDTDRKYLPDVTPLQQCASGSAPQTISGWEKAIPFDPGEAPLGHHTLSITGNSYKALADNLIYVRYRHKETEPAELASWSDWLGAANHNACHSTAPNYEPQLAIGWVKRVITGLNPFESRMKEITGNSDAPASYVSMLQQAGQRYEGPVALNGLDKDVVESLGLIQAYETVLRRAKEMSIDRAESIFRETVGSAIQLASNRLSQLYTLMGNEAFNDSLDGTVPNIDGSVVNLSSLHAFKNMSGSPIDEELSLLRGKEEIGASPTYNRLLWNYTKGEGEVAYNSTYFVSDIDENGLINEQDAGRLYPQGHGDAWGHYLHALDYYYDLMAHDNYTWVAMGEGFTLAGQAFPVDYNDEEQFARIAAEKAQVGATVADITFRKLYDPLSNEGMAGYPDDKADRAWGAVEWAQRATTGAYFDWLSVNAMTPAAVPEGYNPIDDGVGIIARSSIPEIETIATSVGGIASTLNALEAGSNPFGLNDAVVAFDLDTERYGDGDGLFRQTWERADTAVKNAHTIFTSIAGARRAQKEVAQTAEEWQQEVQDKDREYRNQLIEIFGKPYEGAIGSGKPYPEGYQGPDLQFYNFVDINEVSDVTLPQSNAANLRENFSVTATLTKMGDDRESESGSEVVNVSSFIGVTDIEGGADAEYTGYELEDMASAVNGISPTMKSYEVLLTGKKPDGVSSIAAQAPADWERRIVKGSLQKLVHDALMAEADLQVSLEQYNALVSGPGDILEALQAEHSIPAQNFKLRNELFDKEQSLGEVIQGYEKKAFRREKTQNILTLIGDIASSSADAMDSFAGAAEFSKPLGATAAAAHGVAGGFNTAVNGIEIAKSHNELIQFNKEVELEDVEAENELAIDYDDLKQEFTREREAAVQSAAAEMNALLGDEPEARINIFKAEKALFAALDAYRTELDRGLRILDERSAYNRRIAARIQQLRYKDSTSRVALDALSTKYRRAFDLASRYVYMAARAYDYETNLTPSNAMSGMSQVSNLSKQRLVGRYETQGSDYVPVVGYEGLAETLAILKRNYDVLVSRLGLSVTDTERNVFSLRKEMLSIGKQTKNDDKWLDALSEEYRVDDLWTAPEASAWRTYARTFASRADGAQPGLIIPFSTNIKAGKNFFGKDLKGGDSAYDPSSAVTRIESISVILEGYDTQNLSATPRVYLVPVGLDRMLYADSSDLKHSIWQVKEKVLPLVFETSAAKIEATNFNPYEDSQQGFVNAIKKFSTLRAYTSDAEASSNGWQGSTRLAGRSVWNNQWLLVIPGQLLLNDADEGLNRLIYGSPDAGTSASLKDIKILINSTAVSGN